MILILGFWFPFDFFHSRRRSYYLWFYYLFFTTCFSVSRFSEK